MVDRLSNTLLSVEHLSKNFGGIHAIKDLSLELKTGELLGIIGPNGAGKTALLNTITGFYSPSQGLIRFDDHVITSMSIHEIARLGVGRTFQNIRLFKRMSVLENVLVACHSTRPSFMRLFKNKEEKEQHLHIALESLDLLNLSDKANLSAASLSYGDARRLEIARALAGKPKVLLLDEPAAGMNEAETLALIEDIQTIRQKVSSVVLIEHDMNLIRTLSTRVVAMDFGLKICEGSAEEVLSHPDVMSAYLGDEDERQL
jgi:branched-chain amino acid transport system ATP-binding protein